MNSPQSLATHEDKYKPQAWQQYTLQELGEWVHLFHKRAGHRSDKDKAHKDLTDARNYLDMMKEYLDDAEEKLKA